MLVSEQGLGDTLQFMRYAPMLKQLGARVSLCAQPQLDGLISASEISDAYLTSEQASCIKEGYWIPLLSLPQLLGVSAAEPRASTPYIKTTETHLGRWRNLLAAEHWPIIAIHWQGNPSAEQTVLRGRSFPLEAFAPLAAIDEIVLLSLQKGAGSEQLPVCSFRDRFVQSQTTIDSTWDLLDAAAIIANSDLVITNDTAVAHLAGGMGQRTWLLLQSIPDWRWGLRGNSCPWYPSLRLFRQPKAGQWDVVMQEVAETLRHLLATGMRH